MQDLHPRSLKFRRVEFENALDEAYRGDGDDDYESLPPNRRAAIARAVEHERNRLDLEKTATTEPQTELGRDVKSRTDLPTILIDRLVRQRATKKLRNFKGRGKPS